MIEEKCFANIFNVYLVHLHFNSKSTKLKLILHDNQHLILHQYSCLIKDNGYNLELIRAIKSTNNCNYLFT